jgi:hypothetical protein
MKKKPSLIPLLNFFAETLLPHSSSSNKASPNSPPSTKRTSATAASSGDWKPLVAE